MNDITKIATYYIRKWFNFNLYPSQKQILDYILDRKKKRITIKATTRYGKSQLVALACIMFAILYDNVRIGIMAPTQDKTKIIMGYIQMALSKCKEMEDVVDIDTMGLSKLEKLKREVSKKKITFKNGSYIEVLSLDIKGKGFKAMGFAYDLSVIDETGEIPDEVFNKAYRMLVEDKQAKLVEIGNPWHLNHFYNHHNSDKWEKYTVDWKTAVKEGRMTELQILDQKEELTELEFKVLYDAEFPKDIENSIFKEELHIIPACRVKEFSEYDKILIGIDTAQGGKDNTVITTILELDNEYSFYNSIKMDNKDDMSIVGMFLEYIEKEGFNKEDIEISVDYPMGKGVADRLKEHGFTTYEFRSGFSARNKKRFLNFKAESIFGLADIMKENRFYNLPKNSQYVLQLKKWIFDIRSDRLIHVIDPTDKSPDEADSLNIALSRPKGALTSFNLDTL